MDRAQWGFFHSKEVPLHWRDPPSVQGSSLCPLCNPEGLHKNPVWSHCDTTRMRDTCPSLSGQLVDKGTSLFYINLRNEVRCLQDHGSWSTCKKLKMVSKGYGKIKEATGGNMSTPLVKQLFTAASLSKWGASFNLLELWAILLALLDFNSLVLNKHVLIWRDNVLTESI